MSDPDIGAMVDKVLGEAHPVLRHAVHPTAAAGWWLDTEVADTELANTWLPDWLRAEAKRLEDEYAVKAAARKSDAA